MEVTPTSLPEVLILTPKKFGDARGFFSETYSYGKLKSLGIDVEFVQDNHSLSAATNVVRGLHYQLPPMAQCKLVRVVRGAILDVAVDIRRDSPRFGKIAMEIISAENWKQILVPVGFAHGFRTLEPNTEVVYKVSADYSPAQERGICWNDPALKIDWGVAESEATLSPRDREHPLLKDAIDLF